MKRILSIIILFAILLGMILIDSGTNGLVTFINMPSLIIIVVPVFAMLVLSDNLSDFFRGFNIVMTDNSYTTKELNASLNAIETTIKLVSITAVIGFFIGFTQILAYYYESSLFGPSMGVAVLTILYALIINLFLYGTKAKIKKALIYRA